MPVSAAAVVHTKSLHIFFNAGLYLSKDFYNFTYGSLEDDRDLSKPADIAQVQQLHRMMLETPKETDGEYIMVYVRYEQKNGTAVLRQYDIPAKSETVGALNDYFSNLRHVFGTDDWEELKKNTEVVNVYLRGGSLDLDITDSQQRKALFAALEADCKAGTMAQHDYFHPGQEYVGAVDIAWKTLKSTQYGMITKGEVVTIYEDCVNTRAFLETLEEN